MNAIESKIRDLVSFARKKDGEDRTSLYLKLMDLMLSGQVPEHSPTRPQLIEVIAALVPHVEPEARRAISERMASMTEPPMDLVMLVVEDRANLVSSLLTFAPFSEDELVDVIAKTGRDHHQILATRTDLTANAWIALARAAPTPQKAASPLALWKDGLAGVSNNSDEEIEAEAKQAAVGGGRAPIARPTQPKRRPPEARPKAKLRILRLDKDIEADSDVANDTDPPAPKRGKSPSVLEEIVEQKPAAVKHVAPSANAIADSPLDQPLSDPCPGGWAWRSDRDGFVADLSPTATQVLRKPISRLRGSPMLDLLGLNAKLGHPIARALQRRSTIHDAPLYLAGLDRDHRYWTLDAIPLFDPASGVFEGYEGQLAPVRPEEPEDTAVHRDEDALFTDEEATSAPKQPESQPAANPNSISADGNLFDNLSDMVSANTADLVRSVIAGAMQPDAAPRQAAQQRPVEPASVTQELSLAEQLAAAGYPGIETALENAQIGPKPDVRPEHFQQRERPSLDEALENLEQSPGFSMLGNNQPQQPSAPSSAAEPAALSTSTNQDPQPLNGGEGLERTIQLLEQAIEALLADSRNSGHLPTRLQAEIAAACLRVLREYLA